MTEPERSKTMKRVLVVPWSIAPRYGGMRVVFVRLVRVGACAGLSYAGVWKGGKPGLGVGLPWTPLWRARQAGLCLSRRETEALKHAESFGAEASRFAKFAPAAVSSRVRQGEGCPDLRDGNSPQARVEVHADIAGERNGRCFGFAQANSADGLMDYRVLAEIACVRA